MNEWTPSPASVRKWFAAFMKSNASKDQEGLQDFLAQRGTIVRGIPRGLEGEEEDYRHAITALAKQQGIDLPESRKSMRAKELIERVVNGADPRKVLAEARPVKVGDHVSWTERHGIQSGYVDAIHGNVANITHTDGRRPEKVPLNQLVKVDE